LGFDIAGTLREIAHVFRHIPRAIAAALLGSLPALASAEENPQSAMKPRHGLVIHGGAGTILRSNLTPELEAQYTAALTAALDAGYAILDSGGTSLDAVVASIRLLEDSPLFNAGVGAVMTADGNCELDASIMNGADRAAGAVAGVRRVRNPITLARDVMERSAHVMLTGEGAERFAESIGHTLVDNSYFHTERRREQLEDAKKAEALKKSGGSSARTKEQLFSEFAHVAGDGDATGGGKFGTVGCVALDRHGNLAAGTSTGGMTNKRWGRVGDSPVIGAGTYADNATCAVSATGWGEFFIRASAAHEIASRIRYGNETVDDAAKMTIDAIGQMGGTGGVIAIDRNGAITMPFNTEGMYRAWRTASGDSGIAIYRE
jgi:beta-aspartyl-peptidase (threonine type)